MAEFDSPLGKKRILNQGRKVFNVPDESQEQEDEYFIPPTALPNMKPGVEVELTPTQFQEMQQRRTSFKNTQGKASGEARQRIELLTNIGRLTKEVEIEGHKFTLQSLKSKEMRETIKAVSQANDGADSIFEMRAQILARSIIKIDGHSVEIVLGDDSFEEKLNFIDDSEETIVNQLYAAYTEMTKKIDLNVKNAVDAKEIAEEIKK